MALGALAFMGLVISAPSRADDLVVATVAPAQITPQLEAQRMQQPIALRPGYAAPTLTNDLLAAYVARQQQIKTFSSFDVQPSGELNEQVLLGYIDRTRSQSPALAAIPTASPISRC